MDREMLAEWLRDIAQHIEEESPLIRDVSVDDALSDEGTTRMRKSWPLINNTIAAYGSGIFAQTYMDAFGISTIQPASCRPFTSTSRRRLYWAAISWTHC